MKQLVTIIITNYNKGHYIKKCLDSCIKQDYKKYEIILVDNQSSDNSLNIIKKFKNIKIIIKKRKFQSPASNQIESILFALKKAKGEIICLLDSDDFFKKNKISSIIKYFNENKQINFSCDIPVKYDYQKRKIFYFQKRNNINKIWPTIFPTSSLSFRKKFKKNIYKYIKIDKFNMLEIDLKLCILANLLEKKINLINKNLTFYTQNTNGIMSDYKKYRINWWIKRYQAHAFLSSLLKQFGIKRELSFDYYLTKIMFYLNLKLFSLFTKNKK